MKDNTTALIIGSALVVAAVIAAVALTSKKQQKGYQGQSSGKEGGFWSGLWNNAANIVDAGGRHTSSFVTSLGNTIVSIKATEKGSGKGVFSEYGYSDPEYDKGPYILGGALILATAIVAAIIITKN